MKKNILMLINGFGVEQRDSYDIYSAELMPNMDKLTKEGLFSSLSSKDLDYKSGYRSFSIGIKESLSYSIVENSLSNDSYKNSQVLKYLYSQLGTESETKLHIFCFWDNDRTVEQLLTYLKDMKLNIKTKIFIHLIMTQRSLSDYKDIDRCFTTLNYELGDQVKLGVVAGEQHLENLLAFKDFIKTLVAEAGEKWKDLSKKTDVLLQSKTIPAKARTFAVNPGYGVNDGDFFLFFNYSNVDVTRYIKEIDVQKYRKLDSSTIKAYSLFPVKCDVRQIPFMFNFAVSSTYALKSLESIGAKAIVLAEKDKCPYINYYMTGLRNTVSENLKYLSVDDGFIYDPDKVIATIKAYPQELIIINYEIETCKNVGEIEDRLKSIDAIIGKVSEYTLANNYGFFLSSLYGIEKEMYNNKNELCKVNFSVRVPVVVYDKGLPGGSYSLNEGTTYDLFNAIIHNINPVFENSGIIKKKSGIMSIFFKKSKGDKK